MPKLPYLVIFPCLLVLCGAVIDTGHAQQQIAVEPRGEFATVETGRQVAIMRKLLENDTVSIEAVLDAPGDFIPPVLYVLAGVLFESGRKDEAAYWFYSGQLRGRSDANKALDPSASSAIDVLNSRFGPRINQHAFRDREKLVTIVENVVADDRAADRTYDPRWIALHGMDAFMNEKIRFEPDSEWGAIDEATRQEYLAQFRKAMAQWK